MLRITVFDHRRYDLQHRIVTFENTQSVFTFIRQKHINTQDT